MVWAGAGGQGREPARRRLRGQTPGWEGRAGGLLGEPGLWKWDGMNAQDSGSNRSVWFLGNLGAGVGVGGAGAAATCSADSQGR